MAVYESKIGLLKIVAEDEQVVELRRLAVMPENPEPKDGFTDFVYGEIAEYLLGQRKEFTFGYRLKGTDFQQKVWKALTQIPYGETRSYKEIAIAIGNEKASRAVGMANNKNPISIAVPCHRVIGHSGKLVGYGGGLEMKAFLLALESKNIYD